MGVARQDHHQRLLDEKTERQVGHPFFPSKKSCIDSSVQKAISKLRRVLTRYHHIGVGQFVAQDPQGFRHPCQFVSSQKTHDETRLGWTRDPPASLRFPLSFPYHQPAPTEKDPTPQ